MNKLLLSSVALVAVAGLAGGAMVLNQETSQQSMHLSQTVAVVDGNVLTDEPVPAELAANAAFGAAVEKALTEVRNGSTQSLTDTAQRFQVTVSASAGAKLVQLYDTGSNTMAGSWQLSANASETEKSVLLATITEAAGLKPETVRGVASDTSDRIVN